MKNNFRILTFLLLLLAGFSACNKYEDDVFPARNAGQNMLNPDTYFTNKDKPVQITVLANDTIAVDGILTFGKAAHGLVVANSVGFEYQPAAGFVGSDRFFYKFCSGAVCDSALVTVNILEPNPNCQVKATRDNGVFLQANPVTIPILANDITCGPVTISVLNQPLNGVVAFTLNNELRYTPNTGFFGYDSLVYEIQAPDGRKASASVTVVGVQNCRITANADVAKTLADDSVTIFPTLNDVTCNSSVWINLVSNPQHGVARLLPNNRISYEPDANFVGSDSFTYELCNSSGVCVRGTITVTVDPRPVNCITDFAANNDQLGFSSSIPGSSYNLNVLQNDIYCPNSQATITVIQAPANGTATIVMVGGVPHINYAKTGGSGTAYTDNLSYQLCMVVNGQTVCRTANVTVMFW